MCSICYPDLKICVLYCFFYTFGYFLLYSSPCVSTCEVLGNYKRFFLFVAVVKDSWGSALIICQARHLWLRTGAANSLLDLSVLPASNEKQDYVFWGILPSLSILLCWRTFQNIGKGLDLWLTNGPTSCCGPRWLCSFEGGDFDVVLLESYPSCNFNVISCLTFSELWVHWSIFY